MALIFNYLQLMIQLGHINQKEVLVPNHEKNTNIEADSQSSSEEVLTETPTFNPENAKKQQLIASLNKFISNAEESENYEPEIEYPVSPDTSLAAKEALEKLKKSAIDFQFDVTNLKYSDYLDNFVGSENGNNRHEKVLEALNSGSLSSDETFSVYPMAEGFTGFDVKYALDDFQNATFTSDFLLGNKNTPDKMTTETAKVILNSLENSTNDNANKEETPSIDDIFTIEDEDFWDKVNSTNYDQYGNVKLKFDQINEDDRPRYALEIYKKFGENGYHGLNKCKDIILDVLSDNDKYPDLIDELGLTKEQHHEIIMGLIADRVNFMSDDILNNPQKFADFVKRHDLWQGILRCRYDAYYGYERMNSGKEIPYHPSVYDGRGFDDMSDECKANLPKMLKNMEENLDLREKDINHKKRYYIWKGYLAEEYDHDLDIICPITLCDPSKLRFEESYDSDYKIINGKLTPVNNEDSQK